MGVKYDHFSPSAILDTTGCDTTGCFGGVILYNKVIAESNNFMQLDNSAKFIYLMSAEGNISKYVSSFVCEASRALDDANSRGVADG